MSSRLFQNIREKRGLAYAVFSELTSYRDTGCLSIYAGTSMETAKQVVGLILEEFRNLKQEKVADDELRRAKDHLKGSMVLGLESTSSRMANLARQQLYFDRFFTVEEMIGGVEQVSSEEVMRLSQEFFDPRNIAVTVLGSVDGFHVSREELSC
jgi:predicted Zn-dependent peptidase